ncbi:MAG: 3-phosphoshikimate 1-carboxyvinyltransferase [Pyrinomonadaceae bacterium]|nr:3-phosphoshikimate 1-carboxyvinyltransferase [Pyrinomonadaceae bacterium]
MKIYPARRIRGRLRLPGDKSISHRAALLAALADGPSKLTNFSTGADCRSTLRCLRQLGVSIEMEGTNVEVAGVGTDGLRASSSALDCGNSGSTMRLLAGVLAGQNFVSELTGDDSLRSRPMKRIIQPLEMMGARVDSTDGRAPLRITGRQPLDAISYEMAIPSAQVKSCILMAGLNARGRTEVIEEMNATRDHTERMLRWFGVNVEVCSDETRMETKRSSVSINGPARLRARDISIPGDISSAAFFIVAAALLPGSTLQLESIGLNPTRTEIFSTLQSLGISIGVMNTHEQTNEPTSDIEISGSANFRSNTKGTGANILRGHAIARLIDELPVLAVVGAQMPDGIEIRDARELRVKESDRIRATVENLRVMGAIVEEFDDGLRVMGGARLRGARIKTYGDHRIAIAFTVAALLAEGESELDDAECVSVSLPEFFELLESVIER